MKETIKKRFSDGFYDVPNQTAKYPLELANVSISNQLIPVPFSDDLFGDTTSLLRVSAGVKLASFQRGIHMSRIEQAFQDIPTGLALTTVAIILAKRVLAAQKQVEATVRLGGDIVIKHHTTRSNLPTFNTLTISSEAHIGPQDQLVKMGLTTSIITACPCMQSYAVEELIETLDLPIDDPSTLLGNIPIATHSQKGRVGIFVAGTPEELKRISYLRLYSSMQQASHLTSELLKRPDEYELVRRAHIHPQFVEDVVREVVTQLSKDFHNESSKLTLTVSAESYESIHGHDIQAEGSFTLAELRENKRI